MKKENKKLISISLGPNNEPDDIAIASRALFKFWEYKKGNHVSAFEKEFSVYLKMKHAFSFNSGRSALFAILKALELKEGDNVLLQAFTCNAVVNPILWLKLNPVYVDCDRDTFNMSLDALKIKISQLKQAGKNPKVLLAQHTFGLPCEMEKLSKICEKENIFLIEDCAHALGSKYKGKKVGTFAKASFFSFSRDKVISCVYGGMAVTNDNELASKIKLIQEDVGYPSYFWIFQQLIHPIVLYYLVMPYYAIFGKYLLLFFQCCNILSKAVHKKEKMGEQPIYFPKRMPNALSALSRLQFSKLDKFNAHRQEIAKFYFSNLKTKKQKVRTKLEAFFDGIDFELPKESLGQNFLRFAIKHPKAHIFIKKARKENILLGDWYDSVVAPKDTILETMKYENGSCPIAETLVKETLNLPTHINITQEEADIIINFLKKA